MLAKKVVDEYFVDCTQSPIVPRDYRSDLRPLNHKPRGVTKFEPNRLVLRRVRPRRYFEKFRHASGDDMLASAFGKRAITAHEHRFYMRNPHLVPPEGRKYIVHSPGTLFEGYKGTVYVLGFYFVGGEIREDAFLVTGEIADTHWEHYQVIGLHPAMPKLARI